MDYSQLSDFEINRMVGDIIFKGLWACKPETSGNNTNKWYYGNADTTFEPLNPLPDYCNDPSASWPIIEKYRISIINLDEDEWGARGVAGICGTGMKPDDLIGAWACSACHDEIDRRTMILDNKDARLYHLEGVIRTQAILLEEGKIKP
ncbi:TPA: DUF1364 family protein [Escherichia coli]|nr:DUF1364 family protein [Escherichia coli]